MTTIATDGKSMAGDGLVNCGGTITDTEFAKVRRLSDGSIVGFAGSVYDVETFLFWMENGQSSELKLSENFCALHVTGAGVFSFDNRGQRIAEPVRATTGSGGDFALAAMDCGLTPEQAVQMACARDIHSGGKITVEHLNALREVA